MPDKTWNKLKTQSISDKDRERMRMGYKIPLKDGKVDWTGVSVAVLLDPIDGTDQLKALYNHALEAAAEVADDTMDDDAFTGEFGCIAAEIRALKEPTT